MAAHAPDLCVYLPQRVNRKGPLPPAEPNLTLTCNETATGLWGMNSKTAAASQSPSQEATLTTKVGTHPPSI
jgi:hypothetical protein